MYLESLRLDNFKNYERSEMELSPTLNIFTGLNGSGKTNLLDAIYYLSLTKSAFHNNDQLTIRKGHDYFRIEGRFVKKQENFMVEAAFSPASKKIIKVDKTVCDKVKDHIGKFPVILMTPYDTDVIREGSEERRKFFDSVFSQLDKNYLSALLKYSQILKQRNALLKEFFESNKINQDLLMFFDKQIFETGAYIFEFRKKNTEVIQPIFNQYYEKLTGQKEKVGLQYLSHLQEKDFEKSFRENLKNDVASQRTSKGVHKDDFLFEINDLSLKSFGSQGQQKSYVISLKLAQYDLLNQNSGEKPIILLDDIFDKLDVTRIRKLMEIVSGDSFGQIFVTDAQIERTESLFKDLAANFRIFEVENGKVRLKK